MILAGSLIISREGAEILLYYLSVTHNESNRVPAIMGMIIGASIGLSVGFLFYYLLKMVKAFSRLDTLSVMVGQIASPPTTKSGMISPRCLRQLFILLLQINLEGELEE